LSREVVELAGDDVTPLPLESEGKLRILHAEENETVSYSEAAGKRIIENEGNRSEGGMFYNDRR
jgi:hypothetical protein